MLTLTDQNFEDEVLKSSLPVLVDFWAAWCGPCQMLAPIIEELAKDFEEKIKIGKLDVDQNPKMAEKYEILSIPTLLIFKKEEVVKQIIGVKPKEELEKIINEVV
ncbi:thioredoxin [Candidatus Gottesmanbacteria bacterium]|nr:thioredoxin [Candidatus Gottesmanbacteria bacterium]MBI5465508.1 thioredoxin [Candidatus Gottesmanbacteria bacterium]